MPPAMGGLKRQNQTNLEALKAGTKGLVFTIEGIGNDSTEGPPCSNRTLHKCHRELRFGAEGRVGLAARKPVGRCIRFDFKGVVDSLVGPEAGDRDDAIV